MVAAMVVGVVVSVVTTRSSDDCNAGAASGPFVHLRISRVGQGWAFHSSADGRDWAFVRPFRVHTDEPVRIGFMSQAPPGERCVSQFERIELTSTVPADLRDGS